MTPIVSRENLPLKVMEAIAAALKGKNKEIPSGTVVTFGQAQASELALHHLGVSKGDPELQSAVQTPPPAGWSPEDMAHYMLLAGESDATFFVE